MPYLHVSEARLFARIHSFTISCPVCGDVWKIGAQRSGGPQAERRSYDTRTQEWRCPGCRFRVVLGVLAWIPSTGHAQNPPSDAVANVLQGMRLTEKYGSRVSGVVKQAVRAKVNAVVEGELVGTPEGVERPKEEL